MSAVRIASSIAVVVSSLCVSAPALADAGHMTVGGQSGESTWIADASAGVPRLRDSNFNLVGDLTAGWSAPKWGVVASGAAHSYNLDSTTTHSDLDAYSGQAEGWMHFGSDDAAFEVRARFGASLYDTTFVQVPAGGVAFQDETSVMYRGALLVGARLRPSETFELHALVGGGVYDEEYNATQFNGGATTTAAIADTSRFAARGEARLQLRWLTVPGTLSLRLRSEAQLYSLTRSADLIRLIGGSVGASSTTDTLSQIETSNRLFVHVDALMFADVSPALFGGIDTLSVSGAGASKGEVVPVFGIGFLKAEP